MQDQPRDLRHRHLRARDRAGQDSGSTPRSPTCRASSRSRAPSSRRSSATARSSTCPTSTPRSRTSARPRRRDARLVMFVPTPRWAYQGRLQSLLLAARAARRDERRRRAERLLPALAPLRCQGVDRACSPERLAGARPTYGLGSARIRVPVPRVHAARVRRVPREEADRILSVAARALPPGRCARPARQARALGRVGSARAGRFADRVRVLDRRRGDEPHSECKRGAHERLLREPRARAPVPWTLYHRPLERDLAHSSHEVATEHPAAKCSSSAAACSTRSMPRRRGLSFHVVDIDARAVEAVLARERSADQRRDVVAPEAPIDLGRRFAAIYAKEVVEHVLAWPALARRAAPRARPAAAGSGCRRPTTVSRGCRRSSRPCSS